MTYDPIDYWRRAGADPNSPEHVSHFQHTQAYIDQEQALVNTVMGLKPNSILEVGCGWGRVTGIARVIWPSVPYTAIDLSPERLEAARKWIPNVEFIESTIQDFFPGTTYDLVLAAEVLMHIPPNEIGVVVSKLISLSNRWLVTVDWDSVIDGEIAPWNFRHQYRGLYGERLINVRKVGVQGIYLVHAGAQVMSPE